MVDLAWLRTHAVARARGLHLRPATLARGALAHRLGQGPPPPRLRRGGRALLRLARLAARLGHRRRSWLPPTARFAATRTRASPGRDAHARARPGSERARPGGDRDRNVVGHVDLARPRPGGLLAAAARPQGPRARAGPCWAPRAARAGSSARASARRCCATRPTAARWTARKRCCTERRHPHLGRPGRGCRRAPGGGERPRGAHRRLHAARGLRARGRAAAGLVRRRVLVHRRALRAARPRALELPDGRRGAALARSRGRRCTACRASSGRDDGAADYERELTSSARERARPDPARARPGRAHLLAVPGRRRPRRARAARGRASRRPGWRRWCPRITLTLPVVNASAADRLPRDRRGQGRGRRARVRGAARPARARLARRRAR